MVAHASKIKGARRTESRCHVLEAHEAFTSETQLVDSIQSTFDSASSVQWTWMKELNSPSGIADLVAIELSKNWQQARSISLVPARWLYALKRLPMETIVSAKSFAHGHGVTEATAHAILSAYTQATFCEFEPLKQVWTKRSDPLPIAQKIVAIEAKLRDWRRALYQAVQYASFAFESWVVMDKGSLHSVAVHLDEFERRGIGLIGLSKTGQVELLNAASHRMPRMPERFWQANAEISRRLFI